MVRRRLLWQIYPSYMIITFLALFAVAWYASSAARGFYYNQLILDLEARANLFERVVSDSLAHGDYNSANLLARDLGRRTSTRVTVILPSGAVVADSLEDPIKMANHADRPEIQAALAGRMGIFRRHSDTLRQDMMYVAIPVVKEGVVLGAVRTALPSSSIETVLDDLYIKFFVGGIIIALLASLPILWVSRRISRPVQEMRWGAERFARGELEHRLPIPESSEELAGLAEAMNGMAGQLQERIRSTVRQRGEMEAVLSSMREGVMAVDPEERILSLNAAAANLFSVNKDQCKGRGLREMIRNTDLQEIIAQTLNGKSFVEGEIRLAAFPEERFLQTHGTLLRDAEGQTLGALVVLNDVTRLRRLETIRRDFVANVSHELKTPVTSIKGFIETLQEGAVEDVEDARRFLEIIAKQTDRLGAIIEDLLSLSRIEQGEESDEITREESSIKKILQSAVQVCQGSAQEKRVSIKIMCDESLSAVVNAPLLEQALVNLIDNAVKYSDEGSLIEVGAEKSPKETMIVVRDYGCGIEPEHLPRLFERFYRVDKGRSRQMGGTGLGLAIVKHITQAHGGRVTVESVPEVGSAFGIHLPRD